jgi:hypothetical protein
MTDNMELPPPKWWPEYTRCTCSHIDPEHCAPLPRVCMECACPAYRPSLPFPLNYFTARPIDPEMERAATARAVQAAKDSERAAEWFEAQQTPHPQAEEHRLALSEALGLGTGAPWDAIHARAAELHQKPSGICELPHQTIEEEDVCEERRLDTPTSGPAAAQAAPCTCGCRKRDHKPWCHGCGAECAYQPDNADTPSRRTALREQLTEALAIHDCDKIGVDVPDKEHEFWDIWQASADVVLAVRDHEVEQLRAAKKYSDQKCDEYRQMVVARDAEIAALRRALDQEWTPPPPGDTREQLPDHILTLIRPYLKSYLSTACETARAVTEALVDHMRAQGGTDDTAKELGVWRERLRERCRLNQKFTGQICVSPRHQGGADHG